MRPSLSFSRLLCSVLLVAGCSTSESATTAAFESDVPPSSSGDGLGEEATSDADGKAPSNSSAGADGAERAISEADIIQIQGDRLYTLSRYAGLTVIDASEPARLEVLGRYRELNGTPFEMYLRDGVVIAMYTGWGDFVEGSDGKFAWAQTSKVLALDVRDPRAVSVIGSFDIAGAVSDSRMVGDVLYVVGFEDGYCWRCEENQPRTTVLSLNVADPRQVRKVDQLAYGESLHSTGYYRRSITVTDQRMYVAGPEYGDHGPVGSTIQVIDISDPSGDLVEGTKVSAAGQVSSRWQMDEHQGVLRVISQIPNWWWNRDSRPEVQTFRVESAHSLTALGRTPLVIPSGEMLNSVRFDGVRGYAITSLRTDPLFTIDLSDPSNPRQTGELVMPGWVYHMEPRGNRLIGLGYDQGNAQGALTVSIFDVTDMSKPTMLDRVNFGGTWAHLPEDQDRIHKAFRILDDRGLILVPFSGWSDGAAGERCYYGNYRSGVQLVDLQGDDLTLRGAAPVRGEARRALIHKDKLLAVSDETVDSYDLSNRDRPATLGRLNIARNVSHALPLANQTVARITQDWYGSQRSSVDIVALADVERAEANLAELDLEGLLGTTSTCGGYVWIDNAFSSGNQINISYQRWDYAHDRQSVHVSGLLTIDVNDPARPQVLSKLETPGETDPWQPYYGYGAYAYGARAAGAVRTERALLFLEQRYHYDRGRSWYETRLRSIDLSDPTHPLVGTAALPNHQWSGLVVDGADVLLSHLETPRAGRARYYLDRVDLSQPAAPKLISKVNIPGSLLHYDSAHARILSSQLTRVVVPDLTWQECARRFATVEWDWPPTGDSSTARRTCTGYRETLHLARIDGDAAVLEGSLVLAESERVSSSSMGAGRVAAVLHHGSDYYGVDVDCWGPCSAERSGEQPAQLLTLGGFDNGQLVAGRVVVSLDGNDWWGWWSTPIVRAAGTRALVQSQSEALVLDMSDAALPRVVRTVPLYGWPSSASGSGNMTLLSLGMNGVQRIDL